MAGSSAPLRRLGAELRRLREATGRTQADVGEAIGRTNATLVNWEHGKTKISKSDLVCLLAELRVPTTVRKGLERLRLESGPRTSQWAVYGLPDWLRPLVSFEEDAVAVATFEPVIIPGLLQTEDYARATHLSARYVVRPEVVDKWVAARMHRRQRLTGRNALKLHAVIAEAALRLEVGGPAVMAAQLDRLMSAARSRNITIQVAPNKCGGYEGIASNFMVLQFADAKVDPPLGYFDGPLGGYLVSDEGDVASMIKMLDDLRQSALKPADSTEVIGTILAEYQERGGGHD
jgi:transcriptional regulator with XRE-family HTH domain